MSLSWRRARFPAPQRKRRTSRYGPGACAPQMATQLTTRNRTAAISAALVANLLLCFPGDHPRSPSFWFDGRPLSSRSWFLFVLLSAGCHRRVAWLLPGRASRAGAGLRLDSNKTDLSCTSYYSRRTQQLICPESVLPPRQTIAFLERFGLVECACGGVGSSAASCFVHLFFTSVCRATCSFLFDFAQAPFRSFVSFSLPRAAVPFVRSLFTSQLEVNAGRWRTRTRRGATSRGGWLLPRSRPWQ